MTKKVLIKITGTQFYDRDRDKIELTTVGTFEETEDCYILRYNEEQEPPLRPIKVTQTAYKNGKRVEIMREGAQNSLLVIELSKRNLCSYGTECGDLLMGICGRSIDYEITEEKGKFVFLYDIDINGALSSRNEVKTEITPN